MKKLLLATLALTAFALPSQAGVLLPDVFARKFCTMRAVGASEDDAMRAATRASLVSGTPTKIWVNDRLDDADVVEALRSTKERCPQYW